MKTATFNPLKSISTQSGIVRNEKGKAFSITFIRLNLVNQTLVLLDSNYSQLLGFRNRTELLADNSLSHLSGFTLYHCPFKNRVYRIEADMARFVSDINLLPLDLRILN